MEEFNIEFNMPYIGVDTLKQKHYLVLTSTIGCSRLREYMKFEGPGLIVFADDDIKHCHPTVTLMDKYNRLKTNCLIYSLPENSSNMNYFDKLVIYYSAGSKISYYGYVLYNTKTGKSEHIYFVEDNYNDLLRCLNQTFNRLFDKTLYDYYGKKYDALKGRNGLTIIDIPTVKDYEDITTERKNRIYDFMRREILK